MISVLVSGKQEDIAALISAGAQFQSRFDFTEHAKEYDVALRLSPQPSSCLAAATRTGGVIVCTDQSHGISRYAGISRPAYLLIASLLGLMYWRALDMNPLLIWEDFQVKEDVPGCLCAHRDRFCDYALAFEEPYICSGCRQFFQCLGTEAEVLILQDVLCQLHADSTL